ncbi:MAG: TetR/AcrR family transcriptional regulator [Promethearchaeota archaeon]
MNKPKNKSRARSPEKKAEQFDKILEVGKDMFVKYGTHGFSTRILAEKVGMTQPNLYNYVSSKRELWIAIRIKYYNEFYKGIRKIIKKHKGTIVELLYKFAEYYLEFAAADYKRFQIMFVLSAPPSKKIGPLEKEYNPFLTTKFVLDYVKRAIEVKELIPDGSIELFYAIYSLIYGAAKIEADLKLRDKITEPMTGEFYSLSSEEFRRFILKEVRDRIERNRIR